MKKPSARGQRRRTQTNLNKRAQRAMEVAGKLVEQRQREGKKVKLPHETPWRESDTLER